MSRWRFVLIVLAVIMALVLVGTLGYITGIRHTVAIIEADRPATKVEGIPYNWCNMCFHYYPEWYCWLGGCEL